MRHVDRPQTYWPNWHTKYTVNRPHQIVKFNSKPKAHQKHILILKYVAEHPKCLRREIVDYIKPGCWINPRGYMSLIFSNLLYHDFIDYDKNYRYTITEKGMQRLNMI